MSSLHFLPFPAAKADRWSPIPRRVGDVRVTNQLRRLVRHLRSASRGWSKPAKIPVSWRARDDLARLAPSREATLLLLSKLVPRSSQLCLVADGLRSVHLRSPDDVPNGGAIVRGRDHDLHVTSR